jgi:threonine/homoserine/homoserine lactone efflux protein
MAKLQSAKPRSAFVLGVALLGVFPTDIMTTVTVGIHLAHHGDPLWHALPFIGLTLLLLALPAIVVTLLGKRAERTLPKIRDWMSDHSWIVSEIVLLLFVGIELSSVLG